MLLLLSVCGAYAQSAYIACTRSVKYDRFEELGGKHGFFIISEQKDVVINVLSVAGQQPDVQCVKGTQSGTYEYVVILDAAESKIPKIEVGRRNSVYKAEFTVDPMKADFLLAYTLEEPTTPIRLDDQTQSNDVLTDATAAELEFTTTLEQLSVVFNPALNVRVTRSQKSNDRSIHIITALIPMQQLTESKTSAENARTQYQQLEQQLLNNPDKAKDADWDRLDQLEAASSQADSAYQALCQVDIYADQTNHLPIDISDLTPRAKKRYAVLPIVIEKTVYETECSAHMMTAAAYFDKRRYEDARAEYRNALSSKDVLSNMKSTLTRSVAACDSCIKYEAMASAALRKIIELKQSGSATQKDVAEYALAASHYMEILNNYNPDEFYTTRIEKMQDLISSIPLEIAFTVVEWKTLYEGNAIPNVEIWFYYGQASQANRTFTSERKFKKAIDKEKDKYIQKGVTDANGKVVLDIPRKEKPTAIIFNPHKRETIKIKTMSMTELERESKGTYMKRQFRLKMYTK